MIIAMMGVWDFIRDDVMHLVVGIILKSDEHDRKLPVLLDRRNATRVAY